MGEVEEAESFEVEGEDEEEHLSSTSPSQLPSSPSLPPSCLRAPATAPLHLPLSTTQHLPLSTSLHLSPPSPLKAPKATAPLLRSSPLVGGFTGLRSRRKVLRKRPRRKMSRRVKRKSTTS